MSHAGDLNLDFFKGLLQDLTGVDVNQLIDKDLPDLKEGDLGSILSRHLDQFAKPLTTALTGDITSTIVKQLLTTAAAKIAAALPPGVGQVSTVLGTLYHGVQFLTNDKNVADIKTLLQTSTAGVKQIVDGVVDGDGNENQVRNATYEILKDATKPALSFVATQLGVGSVPDQLTAIFKKLDLRSYVYAAAFKIADQVKGLAGFNKLEPAPLGRKVPLSNGQKLWLMKGKDGKAELVIGDPVEVPANTLAERAAVTAGTALEGALDGLQIAVKRLSSDPRNTGQIQIVRELQQKVNSLKQAATTAVEAATKDVEAAKKDMAQPSGPNCFAAGTPLLTPSGAKPIEQFRPGDLVLSRSEDAPDGPLEVQQVEAIFVRVALIWSMRVGGQVVRTTDEHPFYVLGKGWVKAAFLEVGQLLLGHDGRLTAIEAIADTRSVETVYNMRVADYHTYFVGCEEWGFSVWAHNAYTELKELLEKFIAFNADGGTLPDCKEIGDAALLAQGKGPKHTTVTDSPQRTFSILLQKAKLRAKYQSKAGDGGLLPTQIQLAWIAARVTGLQGQPSKDYIQGLFERWTGTEQDHHVLTKENEKAGEQWTLKFLVIVGNLQDQTKWMKNGRPSLDVKVNIIPLLGHKGPHEAYDSLVNETLIRALSPPPKNEPIAPKTPEYDQAFWAAFNRIKDQTLTRGTPFNTLATGG